MNLGKGLLIALLSLALMAGLTQACNTAPPAQAQQNTEVQQGDQTGSEIPDGTEPTNNVQSEN
ncbi:MAG: hypothetical protein C4342_07485 [Armatimonadota bacterium]